MTLVLIEHAGGEPLETSLQAVTFARSLGAHDVHAFLAGGENDFVLNQHKPVLGAAGVAAVHVVADRRLEGFAPDAWARLASDLARTLGAGTVVAAGTERGNEVLARVAARLDVPFAANVVSASVAGETVELTRVRWGGSLLEDAVMSASTRVLSVQPHAVPVETTGGDAEAHASSVELDDADLVVRVVDRVGGAA
ncbi:MAG: electron transfer flavoprotein subunit alpha/FixB family protein, partial [Actinobacteria bacterium]|nr:electron transfer flavoprotein subunit alpha/FixB family protein [Actinomycetota bacterium]